MKQEATNWIEFWDTQNVFPGLHFEKNMELFIEKTHPVVFYQADDIVLDIGCGPGFFAALMKKRVQKIYNVDTSAHAIEECRKNFNKDENLFFYQLDPKNYTDLSFLKSFRFSVIICQSVVQYYRNISEIADLIQNVKSIAAPGARFLITDLPRKANILSDVISQIGHGTMNRYLWTVLKSLICARFSQYNIIRNTKGIITFTRQELHDLKNRLGLDAEIMISRLTVNKSRYHMLIRF